MAIHFFVEDIKEPKISKRKTKDWLKQCIKDYGKRVGEINYIFCSDEYLLKINLEYLNHDYYTDIITFNYNENTTINGDIYISLERVKENATKYKESIPDELLRVIVHGILHLLGLNDETEAEKLRMRAAENRNIALYDKM